jgi:23S rRNA (guanosine2251-2'-O)-methyltransferase
MPDIIYGRQAILECLHAGRRTLRRMLMADGLRPAGPVGEILAAARQCNLPVQSVEKRVLDRATNSGHHQGLALEADGYPYADEDAVWKAAEIAGEPPFLLLLDHVQDPQNVGSLLRTADAAGVHGVFLPKDRAAAVTPAVVRASSGAAEHLAIVQIGNLAQMLRRLKDRHLWVCGLDAGPDARLLWEEPVLDEAVALVVGSEGTGLARLTRERCDTLLRIPMHGRVASLNAAIAGAIAMLEVRRRRVSARGSRGTSG